MTSVYIDESGNSGANLLDKEQPVFALASNNFSLDQSKELLSLLKSSQGNGEIKFSSLKSSNASRKRLINFFNSGLITAKSVRVSIYHKEFMVVTKLVDILIENLLHKQGIDLYKDGANIGMSNMLFYCLPVFCSKEALECFYEKFIFMVRYQGEEHIQAYYSAIRVLYDSCVDKDFSVYLLNLIDYPRELLNVAISNGGSYNLDPAIPSLFIHCCAWGEKSGEFEVVHDASKPISNSLALFKQLMNSQQDRVIAGYDRRSFELPLKSTGILLVDSKTTPQVQVSDVLAGAACYFAKSLIEPNNNDLTEVLHQIFDQDSILLPPIWPTPAVTPVELGTDGGGGVNPLNGIVHFLTSDHKG